MSILYCRYGSAGKNLKLRFSSAKLQTATPPHCLTPEGQAVLAIITTTLLKSKYIIDILPSVNPCVICTIKNKFRKNKR